jgi:RNA polymerase sigma factor (sigma-70 family)
MSVEVQRFNLPKYGLDPEDILQDVRVRIWQVVSDNREIISLPAYIKKIISSAVIDQLRKRQRDDGLLRREEQIRISEQRNLYSWETVRKKAMEEAVGRAVERLISSRRQVVKLYLLSLSIPEISSYLNWTQDKTRNLLYRGLRDLKKTLKRMEAENGQRS